MLEMYTGTPGSGKSLHCAQEIIFALRRGKTVIANFDIQPDVIHKKKIGLFVKRDNWELSPQWLMDYALAHAKKRAGHIMVWSP